MNLTQLNVDIPSGDLIKAKKDSIEVGAKMKNYVCAALRHFRSSLTIDQRRSKFTKADRKISGRPVFFATDTKKNS